MASQIDKCLEAINLCSIDEKKELLKILKILTNDNNQDSVNSEDPVGSSKLTTPDSPDYEKFVSYQSSFLSDVSFLEQLRLELDSMDLYRPTSRKPKTHWLSCNDNTTQCDHFQQFYYRHNVKVHVPIIRWSHCVLCPNTHTYRSCWT